VSADDAPVPDDVVLYEAADGDPAVRDMVVTGAKRGFCAGMEADVSERVRSTELRRDRKRPIGYPLGVPKMLVAAINGGCAER
jgi:enoyl-CoA hydratase/carnithine racemase